MKMVEVVGVRYKETGHIYYFQSDNLTYDYNDKVVVESQKNLHIATVAIPKAELDSEELPDQISPILHKATEVEIEKSKKNRIDAKKALIVAKEKVKKRQLEMKFVQAEYTLDRSKLIFSFTADGRIDFRELVKDLAAVFRTRIELQQIGVRDEAKLVGGIGPCGRPLCCASFLGDFVPVSIKMAKNQSLSLNPTKISGICGRLMCCLQYENEEYELAKQTLPDLGTTVDTPDGKGRVVGLNLLSRLVNVRLTGRENPVEYEWDELKNFIQVGEING
jgi:cell fate regulator YaaT (PSP1 superfamily)